MLQRHLVAELPVIPGNSGDPHQQLSASPAPLVHHLHLAAHQPASPVVGVGGDQLDPSRRNLDAPVGPGLRDQVECGDDLAGLAVDHQSPVLHGETGHTALHQVSRDGHIARSRPIRTVVDPALEFRQGLGVLRGSAAQDQAIGQLLQNLAGLDLPDDLATGQVPTVAGRRGAANLLLVSHLENPFIALLTCPRRNNETSTRSVIKDGAGNRCKQRYRRGLFPSPGVGLGTAGPAISWTGGRRFESCRDTINKFI